MLEKITRVTALTLAITLLPGLIVACSGADASSADRTNTGSGEVVAGSASACTNVAKHDDAKCSGGYTLLDEINDESCSALNDAAEEAKGGALTLKLPSSISKSAPATFSWGKTTAQRTPLQRLFDVLEPSAHAHGRTDGDVYMLVFEDKACSEVVRVFTKETSWKADAASWSKLSAASGPITLTVVLATLDNSAMKDGTDAVASKATTFTIK